MLAVASLFYALRIAYSKDKIKNENLLGLGISTLFGLYTHNLFLFIGFVNLVLIIKYRYEWKTNILKFFKANLKILYPYFFAGILYLPWFIILIKQLSTVDDEGFWLTFDPIKDPIITFRHMFTGEVYLNSLSTIESIAVEVLFLVGVIAFLIAIYRFLKKIKTKESLVFAWFILLVLLVWLYSFETPFFYIRYVIFLIPAGIIMLVNLISQLSSKNLKLALIVSSLFILLTGILLYHQFSSYEGKKADMTSLVQDIDYSQDDLILHTNAYTHHAFNIYSYYPNLIYNPEDTLPYFEGLAVIEDSDYYKKVEISGYREVWVIYLWGSNDQIQDQLERNYKLEKKTQYSGSLYLEEWIQK